MTIKIMGASHALALRFSYELGHQNHPVALQIRGLAALNKFHKPFHHFNGSEIRFTQTAMAKNFKSAFGTDKITRADQVWGVVAGFTSVRIWGAWFWQMGYAISQAEAKTKYHLSHGLIRQLNGELNAPWFQFLHDLRRLGLRVILISAPPPMRIHPSFADKIDPELAILVHNIIGDHWQEFCDSEDIIAVRTPEKILDKDGFLLPEFIVEDGKDDWTHGNLAYGEQMLQRVFGIL